MSTPPEVRLSMPARAEGVGVVRQALAGLADALDYDHSTLGDMKAAVTEACTNVVLHAYARQDVEGALEIDVVTDPEQLTVVVRDHGQGITAARRQDPSLGLGLPLIAALSDACEVRPGQRGGTEVEMSFLAVRDHDPVDDDPIEDTGWHPPGVGE